MLTAFQFATPALASEYEGLQPKPSGLILAVPADWSVGALAFGVQPDSSTLTAGERFTLYGALPGPGAPQGVGDYWNSVFAYAHLCYKQLGYVPDRLTPDVLLQAYGAHPPTLEGRTLDALKSPITGDFPILTADSFVRGGFLIRVLTDDEKQQLAAKEPSLRSALFGASDSGAVGESGPIRHSGGGPAFYIRAYGEHGVILEQLRFFDAE